MLINTGFSGMRWVRNAKQRSPGSWDARMGADLNEPEGCLELAAVLDISPLFETSLIN